MVRERFVHLKTLTFPTTIITRTLVVVFVSDGAQLTLYTTPVVKEGFESL